MKPLSGFDGEPHNRARGDLAEAAARRYLERRGYRLVGANVRTRAGEIDAVAWHGDVLCFIEIKARSSGAAGSGLEAVGPAKQRRLLRAAAAYLAQLGREPACRFDVLALDRQEDGWAYTLVQDAFDGSH